MTSTFHFSLSMGMHPKSYVGRMECYTTSKQRCTLRYGWEGGMGDFSCFHLRLSFDLPDNCFVVELVVMAIAAVAYG